MTFIILIFLEPYPQKMGINIEGIKKLRGKARKHLVYNLESKAGGESSSYYSEFDDEKSS